MKSSLEIAQEAELVPIEGIAERLGYSEASFVASTIADYTSLEPVDLLVSLHACDTATDEAIAAGVRLGAHRRCVRGHRVVSGRLRRFRRFASESVFTESAALNSASSAFARAICVPTRVPNVSSHAWTSGARAAPANCVM